MPLQPLGPGGRTPAFLPVFRVTLEPQATDDSAGETKGYGQ